MFYVLFIAILSTLIITFIYYKLFANNFKKNKLEMFKNVGSSGKAITDVSLLFGVVEFKNYLDEDKNIICYSYREKIKKGERVLITDYDFEKEMYIIDDYPNI